MGKVREIVEFIAKKAPDSNLIRKSVKDWITTYNGKVISFRIDGSIETSNWGEIFYLSIYLKGDALIFKVVDGDYPSPDVIFIINNDKSGLEIFQNPKIIMDLIKQEKIWIMGNLNEGLQFISNVISRDPELAKKIAERAA